MTAANPLRGEAECTIGKMDFRIAVTFSGLTRLSKAMSARTLDEIYVRLLGYEPFAVSCAVRSLIVADDEDKAMRLSAAILADTNISTADQENWRTAVETAFAVHFSGGRSLRDERSAFELAEDAVSGNGSGPS